MRRAALCLLGCVLTGGFQGLAWPFGPAPGDVGETGDSPDCDAPDTCIARGCGAVCGDHSECPAGLACLRFVGVASGFCSRFCDVDAADDRCGCGRRCVELESDQISAVEK